MTQVQTAIGTTLKELRRIIDGELILLETDEEFPTDQDYHILNYSILLIDRIKEQMKLYEKQRAR